MDSTQLTSWLLLQSIDGVGDRTVLKLVQAFGAPAGVLTAPLEELKRVGCSAELADSIRRGPAVAVRHLIDRQVRLVERLAIHVITLSDSQYPKRLKTIPDPPPLLYYTGMLHDRDSMAVAIVGGRSATSGGQALTEDIAQVARTEPGVSLLEDIAQDLARNGWTIVSGMARGIDAAAHRGALAGQVEHVAAQEVPDGRALAGADHDRVGECGGAAGIRRPGGRLRPR